MVFTDDVQQRSTRNVVDLTTSTLFLRFDHLERSKEEQSQPKPKARRANRLTVSSSFIGKW